jgi:hypothetical protein
MPRNLALHGLAALREVAEVGVFENEETWEIVAAFFERWRKRPSQ